MDGAGIVKGLTTTIKHFAGTYADDRVAISCTGKATITNMGAEIGATTSVFPYDPKSAAYLRATDREELAARAEAWRPWRAYAALHLWTGGPVDPA